MLLSSSSASFSSRTFSILFLAMCLLMVTARPINPVDRGSTVHPQDQITSEIVLHTYLLHGMPVNGKVSLGIGTEKKVRRQSMRLRKDYEVKEIKLGHVRFENSNGKDDILKSALKFATTTTTTPPKADLRIDDESLPDSDEAINWAFLNNYIAYLDHRDAIDESALKTWNELTPGSMVATGTSVISLIVYRTAPKQSAPRPTGLVSLKIGKEVVSPQRSETEERSISSESAIYATIGSISSDVKIDLSAMRKDATSHLRFLTRTQRELEWRAEVEKKEQAWTLGEVGEKSGKARRDYVRDWLFSEGYIEGLSDLHAIDSKTLSTWFDLRFKYMNSFITRINASLTRPGNRKQT
ncbi:hypothetical protein FB446DRAFT_737468, partial [Lentinula raphanica]